MQLIMPQPGLLQALKTVCRIVSPRGGGPVLTGVLLEASEGTLRLARTDYETWMELSVPAVVSLPGAIVVPAHQFLELLRHVPAGTVSLSAGPAETSLDLGWRTSKLTIGGFDAAEFPNAPPVGGATAFELGRQDLVRMVRQTQFARSTDRTRPNLMGTLLTCEDGRPALVASDGHRIARSMAGVALPQRTAVEVVVPGKTLKTLAAVLGKAGPPIQVSVNGPQACFRSGWLQLTARLSERDFPPYRRHTAMPEFPSTLVAERAALERACQLAMEALRASGRPMHLELGPEDRVVVRGYDPGEFRMEVPARFEGDPMKLAFNPRYFGEGLRAVDTRQVLCRFSGPESAAFLCGDNGQDDFLYVVLPVKVE